ncbi:MAG: glycosyltransferase family 4 protein [Betaproteobacteria bacterium]|nr:glycosyltransferase family 4 protein [Betaproteobacteria bacterium]
MRILMTATSYPRDASDWRGVFIARMIESLAARQIELSYWGPPGPLPMGVREACTRDEQSWLKELMERGGIAHRLRHDGLRGKLAACALLRRLRAGYRRATDIDLFHANWLQTALPLPNSAQPLLVTVLGTDLALLKLPFMTATLRRVFRQRPTIVAPNADWMVPQLAECFAGVASVQVVPFGIDDRWYRVVRQFDRDKRRRWLLVSRLTRRKIGPLLEWGSTCFRGAAELHILGPMQEDIRLPDWVHYHGATFPEALRDQWFPNAAGLVTLSEHDEGRPQVMLEAMAAGLPIIASPLQAHLDLVVHGRTGWIAGDASELRAGIEQLSDPSYNRNMGIAARERAMSMVGTWNDCAGRYLNCYAKLCGSAHG